MNKKKENQSEVRRSTVTITVTKEESRKIAKMAFEKGLSKSTYMRILALEAIKRYDKKTKKEA